MHQNFSYGFSHVGLYVIFMILFIFLGLSENFLIIMFIYLTNILKLLTVVRNCSKNFTNINSSSQNRKMAVLKYCHVWGRGEGLCLRSGWLLANMRLSRKKPPSLDSQLSPLNDTTRSARSAGHGGPIPLPFSDSFQ